MLNTDGRLCIHYGCGFRMLLLLLFWCWMLVVLVLCVCVNVRVAYAGSDSFLPLSTFVIYK